MIEEAKEAGISLGGDDFERAEEVDTDNPRILSPVSPPSLVSPEREEDGIKDGGDVADVIPSSTSVVRSGSSRFAKSHMEQVCERLQNKMQALKVRFSVIKV